MPLPPPDAAREPLHTRQVTCTGYRRADGLWDIEGHITDRKSYDFQRDGRTVPSGEPIHEMWIRLTLDNRLTVKAVAAVTDAAPYRMCPSITENFQRLDRRRQGTAGRGGRLYPSGRTAGPRGDNGVPDHRALSGRPGQEGPRRDGRARRNPAAAPASAHVGHMPYLGDRRRGRGAGMRRTCGVKPSPRMRAPGD